MMTIKLCPVETSFQFSAFLLTWNSRYRARVRNGFQSCTEINSYLQEGKHFCPLIRNLSLVFRRPLLFCLYGKLWKPMWGSVYQLLNISSFSISKSETVSPRCQCFFGPSLVSAASLNAMKAVGKVRVWITAAGRQSHPHLSVPSAVYEWAHTEEVTVQQLTQTGGNFYTRDQKQRFKYHTREYVRFLQWQ